MVVARNQDTSYLAHHWHRHYAQLSLIARLEMTALLAVSSRISMAVRALDSPGGESGFAKNIMDTQQYFLRFVHQFRFTGVTSQLQGAEMFALWRKTLHLDALFADVKSELDIATAAVIARQQIDEAKAATRLAEGSNRLAKVASLGIVGGLIVGATGDLFIKVFTGDWSDWRKFLTVLAAVLFFPALGLWFCI